MTTSDDQPTALDPHQSRVDKWIETSGRALELRIHRYFRKAGYVTGISIPYLDRVALKPREGDIEAIKRLGDGRSDILGELVLTIECKHSGDSTPWVALATDGTSGLPQTLDTWSPAHSQFPVPPAGIFAELVPWGA